jgi:hypothetical protein
MAASSSSASDVIPGSALGVVPAPGKVFQFKLVLLGDSAVGKSSLVLRFVKGQFLEYQESTIGAAFLTQTVMLNDTTVKFEIWDTGVRLFSLIFRVVAAVGMAHVLSLGADDRRRGGRTQRARSDTARWRRCTIVAHRPPLLYMI